MKRRRNSGRVRAKGMREDDKSGERKSWWKVQPERLRQEREGGEGRNRHTSERQRSQRGFLSSSSILFFYFFGNKKDRKPILPASQRYEEAIRWRSCFPLIASVTPESCRLLNDKSGGAEVMEEFCQTRGVLWCASADEQGRLSLARHDVPHD